MNKKIVVFGSFVVDLMARCDHLPIVGETVKGNCFKLGPGGKGSNQAIAAKRAAGNVSLVTKVGDDNFGRLALNTFRDEGFNLSDIIVDPQEDTGAALIMVDEATSNNEIVVVSGACGNILQSELVEVYNKFADTGILLTQLETNLDSVYTVIKEASRHQNLVILNPAPYTPFDFGILKYVDFITPNEIEAAQMTGIRIDDLESAKKAAVKLCQMGVGTAVITLGENGVLVYDGKVFLHLDAFTVKAVDTTGAGDAFNGGFATALSEGAELENAVVFASAVAALSVTRVGTAPAMAYRTEIDKFILEHSVHAQEV